MGGAEQRLRSFNGEALDGIDDLAAFVVAPTRIPLGVLVGQNRANGLKHRVVGGVLRRDQMDMAALPIRLTLEEVCEYRINVR